MTHFTGIDDLKGRPDFKLSKKELDSIMVEDYVKLIFKMTGSNKVDAERMWVKVTKVDGDMVSGILDNDPAFIENLKPGDSLTFTKGEIISIFRPMEQ